MKRTIACILLIMFLMSIVGSVCEEAVQPYASELISATSISSGASSGGVVKFNALITAMGVVDKLGFPSMEIQVKTSNGWSRVKGTVNKYAFNTKSYSYTISYTGTPGEQYRCIASYYVKDGSATDTRVRTSAAVTAKN